MLQLPTPLVLHLDDGQLLRWTQAVAVRLRVIAGRVWVTRPGDPDDHFLDATKGFFDMVVPGRAYAHGGTGEGELWGPANTVAGDIGPRNAESCAAYNMLKVASHLFFNEQDPKYMDYYERTVLNHILGGRRNQESTNGPENLYMFPVHPGARKEYGNGNIGTCCGGTGLESHVKYQEGIYFRSADESALYVNLYIASTLTWDETGLELEQVSSYPEATRRR